MSKHTPMQERIYQLAKEYYPALWNKERLHMLIAAGKLLAADYQSITGEVYTAASK